MNNNQSTIRVKREGESETFFTLATWNQLPLDKYGYKEVILTEELPLLTKEVKIDNGVKSVDSHIQVKDENGDGVIDGEDLTLKLQGEKVEKVIVNKKGRKPNANTAQ